ncbi:hypothetical protein V8E53_006849 [Lactarius tabidus]
MRPHALELVSEVIEKEMDSIVKTEILPGLSAITPDFIKSWTVVDVSKCAPFLTSVLLRAAQTSLVKETNKKKNPEAMCNILVKQLCYHRSGRALGFPAQFGLFLWSSECLQQTIDALHRCGLSVSYPLVLNNLATLTNHCIQAAVTVGSGIHVFCYDNIQISTSIFVEQCGSSGPAKLTSGTFGVLYNVCNGNPKHMRLAPILERFKLVKGLKYNRDIHPTHQQHKSFYLQLRVTVVCMLLKYCPEFQSYAKDPTLQNWPHCPTPLATTIEEATVNGNLPYHDDIYLNQLGQTHEDLSSRHYGVNPRWLLMDRNRRVPMLGESMENGTCKYVAGLQNSCAKLKLIRKTFYSPDEHTIWGAYWNIFSWSICPLLTKSSSKVPR